MSFLLVSSALANPVLDNVVSGQVAIQEAPNQLTIQQSSQKAILDWRSFNIGAQEATQFNQPAGGIAFNRINSAQGASQIYPACRKAPPFMADYYPYLFIPSPTTLRVSTSPIRCALGRGDFN